MNSVVMVTGGAGFLGSHVVEHILKNTSFKVISVDSFKHKGDSLRVVPDPRVRIIKHDLSAPFSDRQVSYIGKVDYIINAASQSHVERSIEDPVPFVENNVSLALNVLEFAVRVKPKMFFQISTDEVYGAAHGNHKHKEWEPILPSNPYSASKAAQEAIAISYWRTYGVPLVILNAMNLIGERQDPEKFLPMCIKKISLGEKITIHGRIGSVGSRYYQHCRNYADAVLFLMRRGTVTKYEDTGELIMPDRFNVVGECEVDNLEMAKFIASCMHKPLNYELVDFHAARPGHDRRYALDGAKLAALGWKPPVPLWDSIRKTVNWTLAHPEWLV